MDGIYVANMTTLQQRLTILLALLLIKRHKDQAISREPCRTSTLSGHVFVRDILNGPSKINTVVSDGEACFPPTVSFV